MTYPQPNANKYALNGQSFFRLHTALATDGDIYQSEQGAHAFAVGPESDIARVNVAYYDEQQDRFMDQVVISPDRPFIGAIGAYNDKGYAPSSVPGRTLMWPDELYNTNWRPTNWEVAAVRVDFIAPVIDIVQYFSPGPITNGQRNDKVYHYERLPLNGAEFYYLVVPWYGRRFASVKLYNDSGGNFSGWAISGLNYREVIDPLAPDDSATIKSIVASAAVNDATTSDNVVKASTSGMFDALLLQLVPGFACTTATKLMLDIITSDNEV